MWLGCLAATLSLTSVAVSACSSSSNATATGDSLPIVKIGCPPTLNDEPMAYAMTHKIDEKYGIKLQCVNVQTGPQQGALFVSGGLDISNILPTNLYTFRDSGIDLIAFQQVRTREAFDIIVRKGFPLPDAAAGYRGVMKDLVGARLGVVARGAAAEDIARGLFRDAGQDPDKATYIATGLPATTLAALSKKSIDAAITFEPGITEAVSHQIAVQPFSIAAGTGPQSMDWGSGFYTATRKYAASHAKELRAFQKTYLAAVKWFTDPANAAAVLKLTESYLSVDAALGQAVLDKNLKYFDTHPGGVTADSYDAEGDFFHSLGATKKAWHVSDYGYDVGS